MSRGHQILEEAKEIRLTEDRIRALRKPWHASLWEFLFPLGVLLAILVRRRAKTDIQWPDVAFLAVFVLFMIVCIVRALNRRDRMWRELIAREAPDLHSALSKTDA